MSFVFPFVFPTARARRPLPALIPALIPALALALVGAGPGPAWAQKAALTAVASLPPLPASLAADQDGRVRAQLSARNTVTLSAELAARIATLPLRDGDAFREGQVLVSFDCALFESQLQKAEAGIEAASAVVQSNRRLAELNSIGTYELAQAQARLKEAQAEAAGARTVVRRCAIAAPFNGRVVRRHAAAHQYVTPGAALLDIVETGAMEVQMIVPSRWLAWLKPGAAFTVQVDELGRRSPARVQRLGAQIDPVSQSIAVVGVIDGQSAALLPGMSGWATFGPARP
jgi:membrane fusion protein (multidrug efflux system)